MTLRNARVLALTALCTLPFSLAAEVKAVTDNGFTVQHKIVVEAGPSSVFGAMKSIGQWWNPDHSWTGEAANLYMEAGLGGCFCERFPDGGGVEHLRIVYFAPAKQIRFNGALGPLLGLPTDGRMVWSIEEGEDGTGITFTYHVTGFVEGGFEGLAPAVDGVIGEQLTRLGAFLSAPAQ